ncbi:sensor histidine kinase [Paraflavitalea sp. CAU 1676]|uniref:sensor histidine kinase n=1 Tax=Paraflavitalea sp. CAU 1676 TaxID=3032598 RepID=UPI0023DAA3FF|nr:sensor histidine kinase [Paraflavitalea sp. CAU 1676]MDF2192542.1 sensor histidine kinase [Paraflavitalea sp. CAU 1676]
MKLRKHLSICTNRLFVHRSCVGRVAFSVFSLFLLICSLPGLAQQDSLAGRMGSNVQHSSEGQDGDEAGAGPLSVVDSSAIDIAKIRFNRSEVTGFEVATISRNLAFGDKIDLRSLPFKPLSRSLPAEYMEQDVVDRFTLTNTGDSVKSVYFLPGFYCRNIELSAVGDDGAWAPVPDTLQSNRFLGAIVVKLQGHETRTFYCRFNFVRTNVNNIIPRLVERDYFRQWRSSIRDRDYLLDVVTYVACGILLMMIFYSVAVYLQNKNKEFIFYALYTFCTAFLLFLKSYLNLSGTRFHYFYEEYLDLMMMTASVFTYLYFVRQFINTKEQHPGLDRFMRWSKVIMILFAIFFTLLYFFTDKYMLLNVMENLVMKLIFFVVGITFIVYSIKKKDTLLNYLALGNLALVVFSIISLLIMLLKIWPANNESSWSILNRSIFYYEIGLVLELSFFLSGLAWKNRRDLVERVKERERLKLENERKEFEKQMAVVTAMQGERDRISADMHDELGSGVTAIRLMSEILKTKMKNQSIPELEKISNNANELLGKMNTIIWTMKSSNDTVESLIAYIRAHAIEYFDSTPIECHVKLPPVIPQADISGEKRRNIFLSVKEALNNAMKHSQATHLQVDIATRENALIIRVVDNGVGINPDQLRRFGNGLNNMRRRMESIGGSFNIDCDGQCVLTFEAPIF